MAKKWQPLPRVCMIDITFQDVFGEWNAVSFKIGDNVTRKEALDFARMLKLSRDTIYIYVESSKDGHIWRWLRRDCAKIRRGLRKNLTEGSAR